MPHFRSSVQQWKSYITGIGQSGGRRHPHQPMRGVDTPPHHISRLLLLYGTTLFQTLPMSLHSSQLLQHHTKFVKWNIKNKTISYTPSSFYSNQVDKNQQQRESHKLGQFHKFKKREGGNSSLNTFSHLSTMSCASLEVLPINGHRRN